MQEAQVADVNPEFLAALPLNIQEEVLAQQRMEQQRQAAAAANPNDPVNAAEFFQNLQPSLRQAVSRTFKIFPETVFEQKSFSFRFSPIWKTRKSPRCLQSSPRKLKTFAAIGRHEIVKCKNEF